MKKFLFDTGFTGLSSIISALAQLGLQIYVVRVTPTAIFGEYVAALSVALLVEGIFLTRSAELALQYVGKNWVTGDYATARAFAHLLARQDIFINCFIYSIVVITAFVFSKGMNFNPNYILGLALMVPAQAGYGVYKSLFLSASKLQQQAVFEITFTFIQLLTGIIGVYLLGIPGLIAALVVSASAKTLLARRITNNLWPREISAVGAETGKLAMGSWSNFGLHPILRSAFANGAGQIDILILNAFKGSESVAVYKIAKTLSALPVKAAAPLWSALRPRLMTAWHHNERIRLLWLIVVPALLMFAALLVSLFPIYYWADDMLSLIYGQAYVVAAFPFLILLAGTWIFGAMTAWFNFWVIISEERKAGTIIYCFLFSSMLCAGIFWGSSSTIRMSIIVSTSMLVTSIICWIVFYKSLRKESL